LTHRDCRNYAPVDVVKGICHRTKEMVNADESSCEDFDPIPKCKLCQHFALDNGNDSGTGTCKVSDDGFMAYGDMVALTCKQFEENAQN